MINTNAKWLTTISIAAFSKTLIVAYSTHSTTTEGFLNPQLHPTFDLAIILARMKGWVSILIS